MVGLDNSNPGLQLGLSLALFQSSENCMMKNDDEHQQKKKEEDPFNKLAYPSLKLGPPDHNGHDLATNNNDQLILAPKTESEDWFHHSSPSAVSTLISNSSTIKRERSDDQFSGDDEELENVPSRVEVDVDVDENGSSSRKKLRLTKQQSALLEDSFKHHSTLNLKQKQDLARELNLRTRQVEVWFQNRRARTKLKQTESDRELLKKCCETLTEENKRLQKELQDLKSMMKTKPEPLYMQLPVTSLTICSSCKKICSGETNNNGSASSSSSTATVLLISPERSIITSIHAPSHPQLAIGASYS